MDRIEQLMKNAKPQVPDPRQQTVPADPESVAGEPEAQAAHTFSGTFTDSKNVIPWTVRGSQNAAPPSAQAPQGWQQRPW